jgi:hypothetical protein
MSTDFQEIWEKDDVIVSLSSREESEMETAEPRNLPSQTHTVIKSTWYQVNNHHCAVVFDKDSV